jgi:hypothetical protein
MAAKAAVKTDLKPRAETAGHAARGKAAVDAIASLREARSQLELLCQMLLWPSPTVLDGCEGLLASVASDLQAGRVGWRELAGDRQAAQEARQARRALDRVRRLLDRAAQFYAQWQRIRAAMSGYQADGAPGQLPCRARIQVEG